MKTKKKPNLGELRMPEDEFERAMRRALQTPLDEAARKARPRRKAKRKPVKK